MSHLAPLDQIFPIRDAASARLMVIKARQLHAAGVIDRATCALVLSRADRYLWPPQRLEEIRRAA